MKSFFKIKVTFREFKRLFGVVQHARFCCKLLSVVKSLYKFYWKECKQKISLHILKCQVFFSIKTLLYVLRSLPTKSVH